jgi:hypothetical protein
VTSLKIEYPADACQRKSAGWDLRERERERERERKKEREIFNQPESVLKWREGIAGL